jgi:prolyl-tRNA synthetase
MTHSDDDGLVLPPKLAPAHVVILPIYRSDEEKGDVLQYCAKLEQELTAQSYAGEPVRVRIDNRDIRGGEKKWQWVKRGVPLRVEVGPRDVVAAKVSLGRRDAAGRFEPTRAEFVANIAKTLDEIQHALLARALKLREESTRTIDNLNEFEAFFTPKNADQPEIHGGLAHSHFVESPDMDEKLKSLKVTARCVPLSADEEPGKCIFTGQPSPRRAVFAKSY